MSTLRKTGAGYDYRDSIKDKFVRAGIDDIASRLQNVMALGNYAANGQPDPPPAPTAMQAQAQNGLITVSISHSNPPAGTKWVFQYSSDPLFAAPISTTLDHPIWQQYLPGQKLYMRVAAKFSASPQSPWVYLGSANSPQVVNS